MRTLKTLFILCCLMLPSTFCSAQDTTSKSKWQAEAYGGAWFNNKSFSLPAPEVVFDQYTHSHAESSGNPDGLGFDFKNEQFFSISVCRKFSLFKIKRVKLAFGLGVEKYIANFYTLPGYRQRLEDLREQYFVANVGNIAAKHFGAWDTITIWRRYSNVSVAWKIKVMIRIISSVKFNIALSGSVFTIGKWEYYADYYKNRPKELYKEKKGSFRRHLYINSLPIYFSGNLFRLKRGNFEWELGLMHPIIKRPMMLVGTSYNF